MFYLPGNMDKNLIDFASLLVSAGSPRYILDKTIDVLHLDVIKYFSNYGVYKYVSYLPLSYPDTFILTPS